MSMWYALATLFHLVVGKLWLRMRTVGVPLQSLPKEGPMIVAPTHGSYLEPGLVAAIFWPRKLDFFASQHLFEGWFLGWLLLRMRVHPLVRGNSMQALRRALKLLEEKKTIVLFPEGTRSKTGQLGALKKGVALLSQKSNCPVVPVCAVGTFEAWPPHQKWPCLFPKKRVEFRVGKPLPPCPSGDKEQEEWFESLRQAYVELREKKL